MSVSKQGEIREQLERELRRALSNAEWDYLVEERYIAGVKSNDYTVSEVAEVVRKLRKTFGSSSRSSGEIAPVYPKAIAARQSALGAFYAARYASKNRDVVGIRDRIGPLSERQVLGWVAAKHYSSLELKPETSPHEEATAIARVANSDQEWPPPTLYYMDGKKPCFVSVVDPLLMSLAKLAKSLAHDWLFPEAEATNWILTGRIPRVLRYSVELRVQLITANAVSRIVLELDPDMSPLEVAKVYGKLRGQMKGTRARVRPLSERTAVLAGWIVNRPAEETWKTARLAWNREYPEWRQDRDTNFARDAHAAVRRLANPGWQLSRALR